MRTYNQLTQTERYQIYALRKANKNPTEISRILGRHKSTIYRELKRNLGKRGYRAVQAHQFAVDLSIYFEGQVPSRRSLHSLALKEKTQKTLRQPEPQRNDFKPGFD